MLDKIIQNLKVITLNIDFSVSYKKKRGKLLISHRSTSYLCYVPVLEDLEGAGRTRLTPQQK